MQRVRETEGNSLGQGVAKMRLTASLSAAIDDENVRSEKYFLVDR